MAPEADRPVPVLFFLSLSHNGRLGNTFSEKAPPKIRKGAGLLKQKDKICAKNNKVGIYTGKHKWYNKNA